MIREAASFGRLDNRTHVLSQRAEPGPLSRHSGVAHPLHGWRPCSGLFKPVALDKSSRRTGRRTVQGTVLAGISLTPPIFNRFGGEIVKAIADLTAQKAQLAKTEAQVLTDLQTAFTQFKSARSRVERAERELLEHAKHTRDLVQIQYQKGAASLLEYLDAQRILISTKLDYESDLSEYCQTVVLIGQAVGVELSP